MHNISPLSVIAVINVHSAIMPVANTFGPPYALGTLFLEMGGGGVRGEAECDTPVPIP